MKRVIVVGLLILVACGGVAAQELGSHTAEFAGTELMALRVALEDFDQLGFPLENYAVYLQWYPPDELSVVFYPALGRSPMDEGHPDYGSEVRYVVDSVLMEIVERELVE